MYKTLVILSMFFIPLPVIAGEGIFLDSPEEAFALIDNTGQDMLIIFGADYCKYCNIMKKDITDNQEFFDNIVLCYVDIEKREDLVKSYKIKTIPDYIVYKGRTQIRRRVGYPGFDQFKTWLGR